MNVERSLPQFYDSMIDQDEGGNILGGRGLKSIEYPPPPSKRADPGTEVRRKSSSECLPKSACFPFTTSFPSPDDNMEEDSLEGMLTLYWYSYWSFPSTLLSYFTAFGIYHDILYFVLV